jgi:hypothetical protein
VSLFSHLKIETDPGVEFLTIDIVNKSSDFECRTAMSEAFRFQ